MKAKRNGAPQAITPAKRQQSQTSAQQQEQYSTKLARVLPREMIGLPQFVCHRAKVPYDPKTGKKADVTRSATWGTFAQAQLRYLQGGWDGIGFVFTEAAGIVGIDLDKCRDPETGAIAPWAEYLLVWLAGYVEVSPSGTGLHILFLGTLPESGRRAHLTDGSGGAIEAYQSGRFFTLTGNTIPVEGATLAIDQRDIDQWWAKTFPAKATKAETPARDYAPLSMDDTALLTRARNNPDPVKAERFRRLYDAGDTSGYKSQSEADAALCNDLAYMCGPGAESRVADLFRCSALYREKADREENYLLPTITLAYRGRTAFYQPKVSGNHLEKTSEMPREDRAENQDEKPPSDELAKALARIAELEAETAGLRANVVSMNEKQTQLREIVRAPGEQAAPAEKLMAIELLFSTVWGAAQRDEEGFAEGCITLAAKKIGVSKTTGNKAFTMLTNMGVYRTKELPPVMTENGPQARIAIAPGPALTKPQEWIRPDGPRNHGGARENAGRKPKCDECGSENVAEQIMTQVVKRKVVERRCRDCGAIHTERIGPDCVVETRLENQDEKDGTTDAAQDAAGYPSVEASTHTHLENQPAEINLIPDHPQRACIRCRAYDWRWTGKRWVCVCMLPEAEEAHVTPYGVNAYVSPDGEWFSVVEAHRRPQKGYYHATGTGGA